MFTTGNNFQRKHTASMQSTLANVLLGKSVVDSYGRQVGLLLGYSVDPSGDVCSIGIDRGSEGFEEFESDRFRFEDESIVVTPRWEAESQGMSQDLGDVHEKLASLNQLAKQMGIPKSKVDQLIKKSDRELYDFMQAYKLLAERMALRGFEIESQTEDLDEFVTDLTLQFNSGTIDQASYEAAAEHCRAVRARNLREVEDLSKTMKALANKGQAKVMGRLGQIEVGTEAAPTRRQPRAKPGQLVAEMA